MKALKPCPCCGGGATVHTMPDDHPDAGAKFVECDRCQLATALVYPLMDSVDDLLAERWNRRTPAQGEPGVPKQEAPVAWRHPTNWDPGQSVTFSAERAAKWPHIYSQPLYAAPPPREPGVRDALLEPTDAMITAYLTANDAYWKRTDELAVPPDKWRTGTPYEATRESLRAALASTSPAPGPTDAQLAEWVEALPRDPGPVTLMEFAKKVRDFATRTTLKG